MDEMVDAIATELVQRASYLNNAEIKTVYLGGGTPSLLSEIQLEKIFKVLLSEFKIAADAEITLEANPDDLTAEKLAFLKQTPVNRLSIGIQSFFEEDLQFLGRKHTALQAIKVVEMFLNEDFSNMSIDFIFGMQSLSDENLMKNLQRAVDLKIPHISAYSLTVEEKTALHQFIQKGKIADVDEEKAIKQFLLCSDFLQNAGYEHYEISNFALPGQYSQHNTSYWKGEHYLGAGPSAHSFNGNSRQWNIASIQEYISRVMSGEVYFEKEELTDVQKCNEYIFTSLRTMWGIDVHHAENHFGNRITEQLISASKEFEQKGLLTFENGIIQLTREGKLFTDSISAELMFD